MHILRRIIVVLLVFILPFLLLLTVLDLGITETVGNPTQVKKIIAGSNVYNNVVSAVLDQAQSKSGNSSSVSLTDPAVKSAAEQTLSPDFLKQSTESIIDGTYDWLNGKVSQPDFSIDLSRKKTEFASNVAANARQIASSLAACSKAQTLAMSVQADSFDVFNATCLPIGTTPDAVSSKIQSNLSSNQNFLKNPVLNADTLKKSGSDQSVFSGKFKQAPKAFQWAKRSPFILSLLVILSLIGIVFISNSRRKGLRRAGIVMALMGVIILVYAWGFNYGVTQKALPKINISNSVINSDVKKIATEIVHTLDKYYWVFGAVYLILGAGAITTSVLYHRQTSEKAKHDTIKAEDSPKEHKPAVKPAKIDVKLE